MAKKNQKPTSKYWDKRAKEERKWQEQNLVNDAAFAKLIDRYYNAAIVEINKDIEHQYHDLSKSFGSVANIRSMVQSTDIADYEAEAQKLVMEAAQMRAQGKHVTYANFSDEVNERMKIYNATMRINRLEYLKSQVGLHLTEANMNVGNSMALKLSSDYTKELKRQAGILGRNLKFNDALIADDNIAKIVMASTQGANWSQRLWMNQDALKAQLDAVLATGLITGQSNQVMARRLRDQVKSTVKNHAYVAERLARTESARVQYQAQIDSIKAADYKYVKWYAEPGACRVCQEINDNDEYDLGYGVFPVDEVPQIPIHPNCRCSISAYWVDGKNNLSRSHPKLTDDEEGAIKRYISSDAYKLNDGLRNGELTTTQTAIVSQLDRALEKMPRYSSKKPLYRDYFFNSRKDFYDFANPLSPGSTFIDPAFLSTSKLHYGEGKEQLHVIIKDSKSGRDITAFNQAEQEVLFPRNTKLKVVDAYINDENIPTLEMKEI